MGGKIIISSVLILTIILITIISCFVYFNSDSYKIKLALEYKKERLDKLNSTPRLYIYECVYTFNCYENIIKTYKNKFGENVTKSNKSFYGSGEVSFKSERIIIILKNKKEVIVLGEPYIQALSLNKFFTNYNFPIIKWEAYNNNKQFFQSDSSYVLPTIMLHVKKELGGDGELQAEINFLGENFKSLPYQGLSYPYQRFQYGQIRLNTLKYRYETSESVPSYVNAKYEPETYDLETYKNRLWQKSIKNPFVLKERW